ncbi:hypothetical protein SSX86_005000 [Deinandra increscens subsp. villosa]|uniref:WRKY domain-containing protein n=1 Tax=Deinandra increscens subsp. villosa TaxID=3103831 RepID=A0AAP0H9D7_9ASTR
MADWGLQAVIRPTQYADHDHHDLFGSIDIENEYDQALLFCSPHLFDQHHDPTVVFTDELDQLYKPFYQIPLPPAADDDSHQDIIIKQEQEIKNFCGSAPRTSQLAQKLKKRKNQQKKVVIEVTADGLSSDPWAWRKYGQKPIKGSIYPRSYYRCSTSKGCTAKRQVEQSCIDSNIYILTYTADHNHPQPTRRNSLAGINRSRFKATPKSSSSSDGDKTVTISKDSAFDSPTTLSVSSFDHEEVLQQPNIKQESEETFFYNKFDNQGHIMMPRVNDEEYMVFSDDFFEGLEDLGGYKMDSSYYDHARS